MSASLSASKPAPTTAPVLLPTNVAALTEQQLQCLLLEPPAQLLVDCGELLLPHPLGICGFVTQLLELRRHGTRIGLCNVHPELHRCLRELQLEPVFQLPGEALPTKTAPAGPTASRRP